MPTAKEYMTLRAPTFASLANIDDWIAQAEIEVSESNYCDTNMRNKAIFLLTAHWLALNERNNGDGSGIGVAGPVKSEKEGDLARSYGMAGETGSKYEIDPYLAQTSWGVELHNLQLSCFMLPRTRYQ